jgi:hypothetical protein
LFVRESIGQIKIKDKSKKIKVKAWSREQGAWIGKKKPVPTLQSFFYL